MCRERFPGVPRKNFGKKLYRDVEFCGFCPWNKWDLERKPFFFRKTDFGNEINEKEHEFRWRPFFYKIAYCCGENKEIRAENCGETWILRWKAGNRHIKIGEDFFLEDHIIFGAEIKNPTSSAPQTLEDNNGIFRKQTRNQSPILDQDQILGTDYFLEIIWFWEQKLTKMV